MKSTFTPLLLFCLLLSSVLGAQTTLGPGDIAFTGYNSDDPDEFSIVLLKDVVNGTTITFTDDEYESGALTSGEGRLTLTFQASFSCGEEFYFLSSSTVSSPTPWSVTDGSGSSSNLSLVNSTSFSIRLSGSGDTFLAFQDNNPGTTTNPASWVAGINMSGSEWQNLQSNDSELPPTLTNGQTAIAITPEVQNAKYDCSTTSGGAAALAVAINTQSNWNSSASSFTLNGAGFCGFTCGTACTDPVLTSISASPNPVCIGSSTTITINGSLNDGGAWSLREGSCNATPTQTTAGSSFSVSPTANTTYFVTAPNCDGTTQVCESVAVTVSGIAADAGPDQLTPGTSTFLGANSAGAGTGTWSIISGMGGSIISPNDPTSTFIGTAGQAYVLRWTINSGVCGTSTDDVKIAFSSPTALTIGDIAFVEYASDAPDFFSIVFLTDINAGTEIHFTENGWFAAGGFRGGEGTMTATWCEPASCGTPFRLVSSSGTNWTLEDASGNEVGTVVVTSGSFQLASGGDQIFAYQGSVPTAGNEDNFRAAIHMNGDWDTDTDDSNESAKPQIFVTFSNTSVAPNMGATERDNAVYDCSVTSGTKSGLLLAINDHTNWDDAASNDNPPAIPTFCNFSCSTCVDPDINFYSITPNPVCAGESVTLTIVSGSLGGASRWVVYSDVCGGNEIGTSTTNQITFPIATGGTYYVAGVDGCVVTPNCSAFTINVDGVAADAGPEIIKVPQGTTTTTLTGNTPPAGATVSWSYAGAAGTGDGLGVIASPSSQSTSFSGTAGQSYVLRYTINNPGCPPTSDEVLVSFLDPTVLNTGEIAFIAYNSTDDNFAFVPLVDINAGTQITFTERGWSNATGFNNGLGEDTFTLEFCSAYPCGSEIDVFMLGTFEMLDGNGNTAATVVSGTALQLSSSGDQIFAYQGTEPTAVNQNSFLTAIQMNGAWDADNASTANSQQPTVLIDGVNSLSIDPEADNARYDCVDVGPDSGTNLALLINDDDNWLSRNNTAYPLALNCGLSCCDAASISSVMASPSDFCPGDQVTLTVVGDQGGGTTWVWYEGSCGTGTQVGTGAVIMVSPTASTNYFVRAEGGCIPNTEPCMSVVVNVESTPPSINCPANIFKGNDPGQCSAVVTYTPPIGTDNCPGASTSLTSGLGSGAAFPVGITTEEYTVTAANGQVVNCSFTVTVFDNEIPEVTCVAAQADRNNDPGQCSYTAQGAEFNPTAATDNCAVTSLTNNYNNSSTLAGETFPVGATQVRWTATDATGNTDTCSVKIVVTDNELPVVTCQDIAVELGAGGTFSIGFTFANTNIITGQSDNCDVSNSITFTGSFFFTCDNIGILNPRGIRKRDVNGNFSELCSFNVTVTDPLGVCNQPPVANCQDVTVNADANCQDITTVAADFNDGSMDSDGDPLTFSVDPTAPYSLGMTNVVLTVSDGQASDTCHAKITVMDMTAPVPPAPPADMNLACAADVPPPVALTATDNCAGSITVSPDSTLISGSCINDFTLIRTWVFTDAAGKSSSVSQTITVLDTLAPVPPAPPADMNLACAADVPPPVALTATDNCAGSITVSPDSTLISGSCINDFTLIRTWVFSDQCGNTSAVSQTIVVLDTLTPVPPAPPADMNLACAADVPPPVALTATDNCAGSITVSPDSTLISGSCVNDFTLIRTWVFSDQCGNTSAVSQTIVVLDTLTPVLPPIPVSLNLECASDVPPPVDLTATDNCNGSITVSPNISVTPGVCVNDFTEVRTWTFTDACGNTSSASQVITVLDTLTPVLPPIPVSLNLECASEVPAPVELTATDACDGDITVSPNISVTPGACANDYTEVRTWTFTDTCGNTSSASQVITVIDTLAPVLPAIPVSLNLACASDVPAPVDLTATDNCNGSITVSPNISVTPGVCVNDFTEVRTWTFTDACGNTSSASQVITVIDTLAPVLPAIPGDLNLQCASEVPAAVDLTATDNCNGSITVSPSQQTIPGASTNDFTLIRTWTFTDACGNTSSASQTITVLDTTDPVVDCSAINPNRNSDPGFCSYTMPGTGFDATATDNCGVVVSLTNDYNNGSSLAGETFPVGTTTVVWTAVDEKGNTGSCTINIDITDNEDPVIACGNPTRTKNTHPGECGYKVFQDELDATATDNCGVTSLTNDRNGTSTLDGEIFPVGTSEVNWTAVDAEGNSVSCTIFIVVTDNEKPTIDCSAFNGSVRANDPGDCSYVAQGNEFTPSFDDNCGANIMNDYSGGDNLNGAIFPVGNTFVTWTATDAAGNSASCTFNVVVIDNEDPVIDCPANFSVDNDPGQCGANVTIPKAWTSDNCAGPIILKGRVRTTNANGNNTGPWSPRVNDPSGYFAVGHYRVQWRAEDQAGNRVTCTFRFEVKDAEDPSIDCPANFMVNNDPGQCGAQVNIPKATASDNCAGPIILKGRVRTTNANGNNTGPWSPRVDDPSGYFPVGHYKVQWRAEDQAGNRKNCTFRFEVKDAEAPVADCSAINPARDSDPGVCSFTMPGTGFDASAMDNCGVTSLTNDYNHGSSLAGETFPVGTTTVVWTAMDAAGNAHSCTINIVITDVEPPVADCSAINPARDSDPGFCSYTMPGTGFDATATDNCAVTSLTNDYNNGSSLAGETFPVGTTTVVWTAMDAQGNSHSCTINIVITDVEAPVADCSAINPARGSDPGFCSFTMPGTGFDATATDNCGVTSLTNDYNHGSSLAGETFPVGTTTVVWTAMDAQGNSHSCTINIVITDVEPPVADCSAINPARDSDPGFCSYTMPGTGFDATATDNCGVTSLTNDYNHGSSLAGETFPVGTTTVVWTAMDAQGNSHSCTINIVITDVEPPVADCSAINPARDSDPGFCSYTMPGTGFDATATDNCGVTSLTNDYNHGSSLAGETFPVGTTTVVWTAMDAQGNSHSCTINIVITDVEAPVADCSAINPARGSDPGFCSYTMPGTGFDATATDNCGVTSLTNDYNNGSSLAGETFPVGTTTVVWTAMDAEGNSHSCTIDIVITDVEAPVADCSAINPARGTDPGFCSYTMPGTGFDATATDNCGVVSLTNDFNNGSSLAGETFPVGTTTVVWTAMDAEGNSHSCTIDIVITDVEAPVADCSAINPARDSDPGFCSYTMPGTGFDATATDNCGVTSLTNDYNNGSSLAGETFPVGTTTVVWTAMDAEGNSHSCTIEIVITDVEAPVADCSAINPARNSDPGFCSYTMPGTGFDATATDNCGVTSLTNDFNGGSSLAGETFPVGTTTVVWTAMDAEGNSHSCTIEIVITDVEAPVADCSAINTARDSDPGFCSFTMPGTGFDATATDNCAVTSLTNDFNGGSSLAGETFPVGTTPVVWTAKDAEGNSHSCTIDIVITDVEKPMVDCSAINPARNSDPGECSFTMPGTGFDATATDNCGVVSFTNDYNNGTSLAGETFPVGTTTVTWTATDAEGNSNGCTIDIVITDNEAPMITECEGGTMVFNGEQELASEDYILFDATDNCGIASVTYDPAFISCDQLGELVAVTVTVTDVNGNPSTCLTNIFVDGLPCGFMEYEEHIDCEGSDAEYDVQDETFILTSVNCNYASPFNSDEAAYVKSELCGNGEIIAFVEDITGLGWAGLVLRESNADGSKKFALSTNRTNFARREVRTVTNGMAFPQQFPAFNKYWLRLVRTGTIFRGYVGIESPAGSGNIFWQQVMVASIQMNECIEAGLFVTNFSQNGTVVGTFSNVSVTNTVVNSLQTDQPGFLSPLEEEARTVAVYPNPATEVLFVDFSGFADQQTQLQVIDVRGRVVMEYSLGPIDYQTEQLDVNRLPAGVYQLRIQTEGQEAITKRVVIQR